MADKKKILFLLGNDFHDDNRVKIEALALIKLGYEVHLHAMRNPELPEHENIEGILVERCLHPSNNAPYKKIWKDFLITYLKRYDDEHFDLLHCHDFKMLILGDKIRNYILSKSGKRIKLIYDAHEYLKGYKYYKRNNGIMNRFKGRLVWNMFVMQEAQLIHKADSIISVSESICELFRRRTRGKIDVVLIRNMPSKIHLAKEGDKYFQSHFNLPADSRIIIHTGNMFFSKKRFAYLSDAIKKHDSLYIVFIGSRSSIDEMRQYRDAEKLSEKFLFHPQVPREDITYYCSMADIGLVYTWNPKWKSYWYAMPNKLMDTALAGLPILTTSQPEFIHFIDENQNGLYFNGDNPVQLQQAIDQLLINYDSFKAKAELVSEKYSWEKEVIKLKSLYEKTLNS